jgi:hypothetical protein
MIVIAAAAALMGFTRVALSLPPKYHFLLIFVAIAVGASVLGGTTEFAVHWYSARSQGRSKNGVSISTGGPELKPSQSGEAEKV